MLKDTTMLLFTLFFGDDKMPVNNNGSSSNSSKPGNAGRRGPRRAPRSLPRKKGFKTPASSCMGAALYFMFVIGISALIAALGWKAANEVLALNKEDYTAVVEIKAGATLDDISKTLKDSGIITNEWLFKAYGGFSKAEEKIDPGRYELNANMDYLAIVRSMRANSQKREIVTITIPEGYELSQILALLASKNICSIEELKETARAYDFEYSYIKELPKTENRLEGYLFPDTYDFYVNERPSQALGKLISNFDKKFNADMRTRAEAIGMTMHEIVTLASLIEREAANDDESATVSSVIHNRLKSKDYPYLQIDATIQYILPERKENLSEADTEIDNPYNTYQYKGLPPGPIANPGSASLRAALYPENTNYYFYALDKDKTHKFSKTFDEHRKFLNSLKDS